MQCEPLAVNNLGTSKMPHSYYDVSDTNVDSYNTILLCSKDEPYSMLFSDNIPAISFSNLNANAEEYIPTGTSNHNAYFLFTINFNFDILRMPLFVCFLFKHYVFIVVSKN